MNVDEFRQFFLNETGAWAESDRRAGPPWAVTADEVDLASSGIRCWVNGEKRQDWRFSQLVFDIPMLIATLSEGVTLYAGDIIATGTPAGVGIGRNPPVYLKSGDVVRIEVDGIGTLENRFVERA